MSNGISQTNNFVRPSLLILVFMISVGPFGDTEYIPSLPRIAHDLAVSFNQTQFTVTAYLFGYAISQILYGPLSDRFGRKPCMLVGAGMFIVGSLICFVSYSIGLLILGRFVQAIGSCAGSVLSNAAVRDAFPENMRASIFARMNAAFAIAPGIGPIIGGYVDEWFGWHINFLILLILSILLFVAVWFFFPETNVYPNKNAIKPKMLWKNYVVLLKDPLYLPLLLVIGLSIGVVYSCLAESPELVKTILALKAQFYAIVGLGVMFGFMAGSIACSYLLKYWHSTTVTGLGLCIMLVGALIMGYFVYIDKVFLWSMLSPIIFIFSGVGLVIPTCTAEALIPFESNTGSASAMLGCFQMGLAGFSTILISTFIIYYHH